MLKVEGDKVVIGMDKNLYNHFMSIGKSVDIPKDLCKEMCFKSFMFGDLCAIIEAIYKELNNEEETLKLWTAVAENFVKEKHENE